MSKIVQCGAYTITSVPVKQTLTDNWKLEITISWEDDRAKNRRAFSSADPPYHSEEDEPNGKATVVLLDRTVSHWDSLAKNAAARFKISRSWVTRANSRFTRVSSSASAR